MNKDFKFDTDDVNGGSPGGALASQSPWEFSGYSQTVAEEHLQRRTTSIDNKILKARHRKEQRTKLKTARSMELMRDDDDEHDDQQPNVEDYMREGNEAFEPFSDEEDGEGSVEEEMAAPRDKVEAKRLNIGTLKQVKVKAGAFFSSDVRATFSAKSFSELNLSRPLLRACEALGYKQPTPIQAACIPLALTGRDICGSAVTGSGKTAAFALPLLERLLYRPRRIPAIRVLILTPTRELAVQVHSMIEKLAQFTDIRCCLVVGGLSAKVQEVGLRADPDIVIATPGRMIDHLHNTHSVGFEDLAILVLDEADRLLELGFSSEVHELVRLCPKKRQTMLFSATMTEEVNELIELSLVNPVRLSADPSTQRPASLLEQVVKIRPQHEGDKEAVLLALCTRSFTSKVIIFSGTKVDAHRLKILFGLSGLKAAELHGNLTQAQRLDALESFRKKDVDFLIATDVAARGLDIVGVETVINFECPRDITTYVHRVGRTARAGQRGCAVTFICENDRPLLKSVTKKAGSKLSNRVVPVDVIMKWHNKIIEMENSVRAVIMEEREERALRKAEMEANKAQNLIDYESEIYSRPRKTWFQSTKEKRQSADVAKAARIAGKNGISPCLGNAENTKKRNHEQEKNMTRKKRRRLEAALTAAVEETSERIEKEQVRKKGSVLKKENGVTVAELAYRRAKAVKALDKARESGKLRKSLDVKRKKTIIHREKNKKAEMEELFQGDMMKARTKGQGSGKNMKSGRRPGVSKRSFKSKARYKRR